MFLKLREQGSDLVQPILGLLLAVADAFYLELSAKKIVKNG